MKSKRLTRADFKTIDQRRRQIGVLFSLVTAPSPRSVKFACVISKKTAAKAHDRNLIRRRARAAFNEVGPNSPIAYVFTAKKDALGASYQDILTEMKKLIVKADAGQRG